MNNSKSISQYNTELCACFRFFFAAILFGVTVEVNASDPLIEQIQSTYQANQARFHAQYRNKTLNSGGIVQSVEADILGTGTAFYIALDVSGSKVQCITTNRDAAAALNKGDTVTFSGAIHDVILKHLQLSNCNVQVKAIAQSNLPPSTDRNISSNNDGASNRNNARPQMATDASGRTTGKNIRCADVVYGKPDYFDKMTTLAVQANMKGGNFSRYTETFVSSLCEGDIKSANHQVKSGNVSPTDAVNIAKVLNIKYSAPQRSSEDLLYEMVNSKLGEFMCTACADNAALEFAKNPNSANSKIIKDALDGDKTAQEKLKKLY